MRYNIDPKETIYLGIENKENIIWRKDLADLVEIPYLESFYLRKDFHHEGNGSFANSKVPYYYYKIVDKSGRRTSIKIKDKFEITEIEPEVNYFSRFDYRNIKVYDVEFNIYRTFQSKVIGENFIIKDLLFLIDKLSFIPNWDILIEYLRIPELEEKIKYLEEKIKKMEIQIKVNQ